MAYPSAVFNVCWKFPALLRPALTNGWSLVVVVFSSLSLLGAEYRSQPILLTYFKRTSTCYDRPHSLWNRALIPSSFTYWYCVAGERGREELHASSLSGDGGETTRSSSMKQSKTRRWIARERGGGREWAPGGVSGKVMGSGAPSTSRQKAGATVADLSQASHSPSYFDHWGNHLPFPASSSFSFVRPVRKKFWLQTWDWLLMCFTFLSTLKYNIFSISIFNLQCSSLR